MTLLLAALPILLILALMLGLRWGAARAGAAGYLSALLVAVLAFGATPQTLAYAHVKALMLSLDVLYIIWTAFLLYRVADEAGAIAKIGQALPRLTADRGMQALLIGWVFASFLQGAGGFGVPVAVTAPLLVGLGFSPLSAVVIPSVGHGWAVTFGSLGSSFAALMAATGLDAAVLAPAAAAFLGLSALLTGPLVAHAAAGREGVRRLLWPALLIGLVMGGVQYAVAAGLGLWNVGAFSGGLAGLLVSVWLARGRKRPAAAGWRAEASLWTAFAAYGLLILLTGLILLVPPVKAFLSGPALQFAIPETVTRSGYVSPAGLTKRIRLFSHAGAILLYASLLAYLVYRRAGWYRPGAAGRIIRTTLKKVITSSLSILAMVGMAVVMQQNGMTDALAQGLASGVGRAYPLIAPWIGALGAFMTGSNTNSNVVFAALQMRTAELLGYAVPLILAAQTAAAAVASVAAPTKVVVGASTAGMAGKEGDVLRALLRYTLVQIGFIMLLTALAIWVFA